MKLVDFEPIVDNNTGKSIKIKSYVLDDDKSNRFDKFLQKQPLGKFISNTIDYRTQESIWLQPIPHDELMEKRQWMNHFIVGEPQATDFYTKRQLEDRGMVGLYEKVV